MKGISLAERILREFLPISEATSCSPKKAPKNVKLLTPSLPSAPLPKSNYKTQNYWMATHGSRKTSGRQQGPCTTTTMIIARGS